MLYGSQFDGVILVLPQVVQYVVLSKVRVELRRSLNRRLGLHRLVLFVTKPILNFLVVFNGRRLSQLGLKTRQF